MQNAATERQQSSEEASAPENDGAGTSGTYLPIPMNYYIPEDPWTLFPISALSSVLIACAFFVTLAQWCLMGSYVLLVQKSMLREDGRSDIQAIMIVVSIAFVIYYVAAFLGHLAGEGYGNVKVTQGGLLLLVLSCAIMLAGTAFQVMVLNQLGIVLFLIAAGALQPLCVAVCNDHITAHRTETKDQFYKSYNLWVQVAALLSRMFFPLLMNESVLAANIVLLIISTIAATLFFTHYEGIARNRPVERGSFMGAYQNPTTRVGAHLLSVLARRVGRNFAVCCCCCFCSDIRGSEEAGGSRLDAAAAPLNLSLPSPNTPTHSSHTNQGKYGSTLGSTLSLNSIQRFLRVCKVVSFLPVFWTIYFSMFFLWYIQASMLDLEIIPGVWRVELTQVSGIAPLITLLLMQLLERTRVVGKEGRSGRLMGLGLVAAVLGVAASAVLQAQVDSSNLSNSGHKISVCWQIPQYFFVCSAEVLIYPLVLEFVYSETSPSIHSAVQSFLWLCLTVGNGILIILLSIPNIASTSGQDHTLLFILAGLTGAILIVSVAHSALRVAHAEWRRQRVAATTQRRRRSQGSSTSSGPRSPSSHSSSEPTTPASASGSGSSPSRSVPVPGSREGGWTPSSTGHGSSLGTSPRVVMPRRLSGGFQPIQTPPNYHAVRSNKTPTNTTGSPFNIKEDHNYKPITK